MCVYVDLQSAGGRLCMLIRDWIIENLENLSVLHRSWFEIQSRLSIYWFFCIFCPIIPSTLC